MKTIASFIFAVILLLSASLANSAQVADKFTGSLLWKVSGNGLADPSYILGTHHLAHVSFVDNIPGLKDAIAKTQQTTGEILMSDEAAMQQKVQAAAMMPAGESYSKLLSTEDVQALDEGLKSLIGAGLDQFGQFNPGMISMIYTITLYTKHYPEFNPMAHEAIDSYVQRIARENGKSTLGLESVDDQIYALFEAEPLKNQAEALVCSIKNMHSAKEQLDKLNAYYKNGNLIGMYDLAFNNPDEPCKVSQTMQDAINKDRNNKWVEKLPAIMKEKSNLIAVGALHLAGEEGILNQLAAKGYTVEPVK